MKLVRTIDELKKGDTIIVKDCPDFGLLGYTRVSGDVFEISYENVHFTIKCNETNAIEKVRIENGKIFLID